MKQIKANSREDVDLLSRCFLTIPATDDWKVVAHVVDSGLFGLNGLNGWLLKLLKKYRGRLGVFNFAYWLKKSFPAEIQDMLIDISYHVVYGHDTEDEDSVGGWSQREIDLLLSKIKFSRLENISDETVQAPI